MSKTSQKYIKNISREKNIFNNIGNNITGVSYRSNSHLTCTQSDSSFSRITKNCSPISLISSLHAIKKFVLVPALFRDMQACAAKKDEKDCTKVDTQPPTIRPGLDLVAPSEVRVAKARSPSDLCR